MPNFAHRFSTPTASTASTIDLTVREIEDAGLLEILQTPGAAVGNWKILDALLDPAASTFTFAQQLGHAREVKTAISGLFGRFVARAYATKFLGLTHFTHVRKPPMTLTGHLHGALHRVAGANGDMPDWVAWGVAPGMAIVEAKGCHHPKGPEAALARAYSQAQRAEIRAGAALAPFKRFAIATRWGFSTPIASQPMLWVHDPDEEGAIAPEEVEALALGIARWHIASLLDALGHKQLAKPIHGLIRERFKNRREAAAETARGALDRTETYRVNRAQGAPDDEVIGGFVTKGGPLGETDLSIADQEALARLALKPTFVGIERHSISDAIDGRLPKPLKTADSPSDTPGAMPRRAGEDGAGSWVVRLEGDEAQVGRARPIS
ncbi:MAG TPA: hypothetical protein VF759_17620 [Allosphingosinicella sp.]|jgi:hypothetical protein